MGCFEAISFVDNEREGIIGKLEDVESSHPEYNCAIAVCDDEKERLERNKNWRHFTIFQFYFTWILLFLYQLIQCLAVLLTESCYWIWKYYWAGSGHWCQCGGRAILFYWR